MLATGSGCPAPLQEFLGTDWHGAGPPVTLQGDSRVTALGLGVASAPPWQQDGVVDVAGGLVAWGEVSKKNKIEGGGTPAREGDGQRHGVVNLGCGRGGSGCAGPEYKSRASLRQK